MTERTAADGGPRLTIVHVVSAPTAGGVEIYIKQLSDQLRRLGHRPVVAFLRRAGRAGRSIEFERSFLEDLERCGVEHLFLSERPRGGLLSAARRLRRYCRESGADIYHSHLKAGIVTGVFLRIPRLHTHHTGTPRAPLWAYRVFNQLVDQYVGICDDCAELLRQYSGRAVVPIRNGTDLSRFSPRLRAPEESSLLRLIAVGRIFPPKNYPLMVEAMALLPPAVQGRIRLQIAGEGPDFRAVRQKVAEASLDHCIELLGNRSDVPDLLDAADLFVMSSSREGFPISLLEATAAGLPFVAPNVGGCAEMARVGGNGVIIPPGDAQALADAIVTLAEKPLRLAEMSAAALKNAKNLSIEAAAQKHVQLYRSLAAARARGGLPGRRKRA